MSIIHGPQRKPAESPPDLTYEAAVEATRLDYARLLYEHDLSWIAYPDGRVEIVCCCSEQRFGVTAQQGDHIRGAIRAMRGPLKKK